MLDGWRASLDRDGTVPHPRKKTVRRRKKAVPISDKAVADSLANRWGIAAFSPSQIRAEREQLQARQHHSKKGLNLIPGEFD